MTDLSYFINRDVADLIFRDYVTKKFLFLFDKANVTTPAITGDGVSAYGGHGHPVIGEVDGNRGGTLTIETQASSVKLWSLMSGSDVKTTGTFVSREVVTCTTASKLNIAKNPNPVTAIQVFPADDDGGTELKGTYSAIAATTPATGYDITFTAGEGETATIAQGSKYIVYYVYDLSSVYGIKITSTTFPKYVEIYGSTTNQCDGVVGSEKFVVYKAKAQPNFTLARANSGDPTSLSITFNLSANEDGDIYDHFVA